MQHGKELLFGQHRHAQRLCFGQLGARRRTGHNIGRFFGDGAAGFAAVFHDQCLGFVAGEGLQRTGDHQCFARKLVPLRLALPLHIDPGICKAVHKVGGAFLGKELHHALRHHTAKAVDLTDLLCGGFPDGLQRAEMLCQQRGRLITDIADAKTKKKFIQIVLFGGSNGL